MTWLSAKIHLAGVGSKQLCFFLNCNKTSASSSTANTEILFHTNLLLLFHWISKQLLHIVLNFSSYVFFSLLKYFRHSTFNICNMTNRLTACSRRILCTWQRLIDTKLPQIQPLDFIIGKHHHYDPNLVILAQKKLSLLIVVSHNK